MLSVTTKLFHMLELQLKDKAIQMLKKISKIRSTKDVNKSLGKIVNFSCPDPGRGEKTNLNFYFHTSLWCLKRFNEGLKGLYKTF